MSNDSAVGGGIKVFKKKTERKVNLRVLLP